MKNTVARLHAHIPKALHTALKKRALRDGQKMTAVVIRALEQHLEKK